MNTVGVSVIIIAYNEEDRIENCIRSVLAVDYSPLEVLIVDASEDSTGNIVKSLIDGRIRYFSVSSKGYSLQRNIGIQSASYPIVAFTDADCTVPSDWLDKLVPMISENIVAVGGNAFPPNGTTGLGLCIACLGFPAGGAIGLDANLPNNNQIILATCNAVFRKKVLLEIGGFDESLEYGGEDSDICRRIYQEGYRIKYLPESYVSHRVRVDILEFISWCIRRGKAQAQLADTGLPAICLNILILSIFTLFLLIVGITSLYNLQLGVLGTGFLLCISSLALVVGTRKYRLVWSRRKRIGILSWELLILVPALFFIRRLFMALGGIKVMIDKTTSKRNC